MQLIDKAAVVAEIEKQIKLGKIKCQQSQENNYRESYVAWSEHIATCGKILTFINTLEVIDPYEQRVQYDSIKAGIQAHAETYSFNIESELFNQLTIEQQKLWRKEIEQACISGGETGVELARDIRYDEPREEINLDKAAEDYAFTNWEDNDYHEGASEGVPFDPIGYTEKVFKAGAEWMSNQLKQRMKGE